MDLQGSLDSEEEEDEDSSNALPKELQILDINKVGCFLPVLANFIENNNTAVERANRCSLESRLERKEKSTFVVKNAGSGRAYNLSQGH